MEKQLKIYFKRIKALLDCPPKDARRCIKNTCRYVEEIQQEKPALQPEQIVEMLGEPEEIAQTFLSSLHPLELRRYRRRKQKFLRALVWTAVIITILALRLTQYYLKTPANVSTKEYHWTEVTPDEVSGRIVAKEGIYEISAE